MEGERLDAEQIRLFYNMIDNLVALRSRFRQHKMTAKTQYDVLQTLQAQVNPAYLDLSVDELQQRIQVEEMHQLEWQFQSEENKLWAEIQVENEQIQSALERLRSTLLRYQEARVIREQLFQATQETIERLGNLALIEGIRTSKDVDYLFTLVEQQSRLQKEIQYLQKQVFSFEIIIPLLGESMIRSEQEWRIQISRLEVPFPTATESIETYIAQLNTTLESLV